MREELVVVVAAAAAEDDRSERSTARDTLTLVRNSTIGTLNSELSEQFPKHVKSEPDLRETIRIRTIEITNTEAITEEAEADP